MAFDDLSRLENPFALVLAPQAAERARDMGCMVNHAIHRRAGQERHPEAVCRKFDVIGEYIPAVPLRHNDVGSCQIESRAAPGRNFCAQTVCADSRLCVNLHGSRAAFVDMVSEEIEITFGIRPVCR